MNDIERAMRRDVAPVGGGARAGVSRAAGRTPEPDPPRSPARELAVRAPSRSCRLPVRELAATGHLTPDTPKSALTEQYRRIKRPLLENLDARGRRHARANVIAVTSSVAGEGKTYTALNLAMSLALERDRTVLLVDADVVQGTATRRLGLGRDAPGLMDLLGDDPPDLAALVTSTDVPDLRVLPAGRSDDRATELLSSERMSALMRELASRYADRIIVLDCPPMLAATEAGAIVAHAGQAVFVVAEGATLQRDVDEALARLDPHCLVGVLVNKSRTGSGRAYRYGYG